MVTESNIAQRVQNLALLEKSYNQQENGLNWQSLPEIWNWAANIYKDKTALIDSHHENQNLTYTQMNEAVCNFASGLQSLGFNQGDMASIFSENSYRWFIADQGVMSTGGINAVRSSNAPVNELLYILEHSESKVLIVENIQTFNKIKDRISSAKLELIISLWGEFTDKNVKENLTLITFNELISLGKKHELKQVRINPDDMATLIYTSGTTGQPKAAMLSHGNLLHQVLNLNDKIQLKKGHRVLSILPTWHAYERSAEYYVLSKGASVVYTNIRSIKQDLVDYKPQCLVAVPRIWESLYDGIQSFINKQPANKQRLIRYFIEKSEQYTKADNLIKQLDLNNINPTKKELISAHITKWSLQPIHKLADKMVYNKIRNIVGGKFIRGICGGGALATHIDNFFNMVGIQIIVGYGLTETAPVLSARYPNRNPIGSIGTPMKHTQLKIVNPQTKQEVQDGQRGVLFAKGPQVMKGYFKNPEATAQAIDKDGWFNTGDLAWKSPKGEFFITGRMKELIVLSNGEKVEPTPVETACLQSKYINQIVLVGQDKKSLGALIVPNKEALDEVFNEGHDFDSKEIQNLFKTELKSMVKNRNNYSIHENIGTFKVVSDPFTIENGMLTQTMKIKRDEVSRNYEQTISQMFE